MYISLMDLRANLKKLARIYAKRGGKQGSQAPGVEPACATATCYDCLAFYFVFAPWLKACDLSVFVLPFVFCLLFCLSASSPSRGGGTKQPML